MPAVRRASGRPSPFGLPTVRSPSHLTTPCCPAFLPLQLQSRLCNGTQPSTATDLGSLAPTLEQLLGGGLAGLAGQLDGLLGTNGTIQVGSGRAVLDS